MKNTKGITLVALVVTVIVLIILAAVTINLLIGTNGIISRSQEAGGSYQKAQEFEELTLYVAGMKLTENVNEEDYQEILDKSTGKEAKIIEQNGEVLFIKYTESERIYYADLDGIVFEISEDDLNAVARIDKTLYRTLGAAVDAVTTDNVETTIHLLCDVDNTNEYSVTINADKNIVLNLRKNIISYISINNYGDLKFINGEYRVGDMGGLKNYNKISIDGLTTAAIFSNEGIAKITNSNILEISEYHAISNLGEISIEDSTLNTMIRNWYEGVMSIKNCEITARIVNQLIISGGKLDILDGTKIRGDRVLILNEATGECNITGNDIIISMTTNQGYYAINNRGAMNMSGEVLVDNTIKTGYSVLDNSNILNISAGVKVTGLLNTGSVLNNTGTLKMTGGTIENRGTAFAIRNTGTATLSSNVVTIPENSGTIQIQD